MTRAVANAAESFTMLIACSRFLMSLFRGLRPQTVLLCLLWLRHPLSHAPSSRLTPSLSVLAPVLQHDQIFCTICRSAVVELMLSPVHIPPRLVDRNGGFAMRDSRSMRLCSAAESWAPCYDVGPVSYEHVQPIVAHSFDSRAFCVCGVSHRLCQNFDTGCPAIRAGCMSR